MPFEGADSLWAQRIVLHRVKIGQIHSQSQVVTSLRCSLFLITLGTC